MNSKFSTNANMRPAAGNFIDWRVVAAVLALALLALASFAACNAAKKEVNLYPAPQSRPEDGMTEKIVSRKGSYGLYCGNWQATRRDDRPPDNKPPAVAKASQPGDRAVMIGANRIVSRSGREMRFSRVYGMVATAYTYTGCNTATGVPPRVGTVAVDPSVIPLGSRLFVEGYGFCKAMDTGGSIKGNRIDVFLETKKQALSWGRQNVKVYLLD